VHLAEKVGKPVSLIAVAGKEAYSLILQAGQKLRSSRVIFGVSSMTSVSEQEKKIRQAWEQLPIPRPPVKLEIVGEVDQVRIPIELGSALSRPSEETSN